MSLVPRTLLALALLFPVACRTDTTRATVDGAGTFLYDDLGSHHRPITTGSPEAQRWFDQGLVLAYAFNHDEARRSFEQVVRLDPDCAIGWWGIALVLGPHINNPVVAPESAAAAWRAVEKARALAAKASPVERALIEALAQRYTADPQAERAPLDRAYADAMRAVWRAHPDDADVGTLFAESMMDLRPWDLWTRTGEPQPGTDEVVATLEAVLARAPRHPGACHLYIHTMEASPVPEKALAAADTLRTLVPGAGHLVHMPGHIDLRLGRYSDAALANEHAIAADERHRALFPKAGFYRVYMAHNHHFLAFTAMMEGRSEAALDASRALVAGVPPEFVASMGPVIDGFLPIVLHSLVRFGRWEEVLAHHDFPAELLVSRSMRHYARGVALTALGRTDEAGRELAALDAIVAKLPAEAFVGNNAASDVLAIAQDMLAGELAFRRGDEAGGIARLRAAAAKEDLLRYDEPPDWMMPVRHALGAMLVESQRFAEAEAVYREDLARFPENGWSLFGLALALEGRAAGDDGRAAADEGRAVKARFAKAWKRADVELDASCFCQAATP